MPTSPHPTGGRDKGHPAFGFIIGKSVKIFRAWEEGRFGRITFPRTY
jgi:hypothetical protein